MADHPIVAREHSTKAGVRFFNFMQVLIACFFVSCAGSNRVRVLKPQHPLAELAFFVAGVWPTIP
jgi:hypothetical protein